MAVVQLMNPIFLDSQQVDTLVGRITFFGTFIEVRQGEVKYTIPLQNIRSIEEPNEN